jgi:hypothetical protein
MRGMSGMCILSVSKNVKENAVFFDIFRNEKNAPFTSHFSEVYFGPIMLSYDRQKGRRVGVKCIGGKSICVDEKNIEVAMIVSGAKDRCVVYL